MVLLGNNLINAAAAALVARSVAFRLFGENELALTLATLAVTFFLLVFSEITPKVIGATYPERVAFPASYVLAPLLRLAYPLVWFINLFVNARCSVAASGSQPSTESGLVQLSLEELRTLVLEGGNFLPPKHQKILLNLFDLESITVDDLMTPRSQIETLDLDLPPTELRRQLASCEPYTHPGVPRTHSTTSWAC